MLLIGYFEGIESERGICWRCSDSLSLRAFLGLSLTDRVPDHSSLSRIRHRLPESVFATVFDLVLGIVAKHGLLKGQVAGIDSSVLRADASMKAIVRRDGGEDYQAFITRLASEDAGREVSLEEARAFDRKRQKRTSNQEWVSSTDADARITRLKDGRTRLAYKVEHVLDLQTEVLLSARILPGDAGDTRTLWGVWRQRTRRSRASRGTLPRRRPAPPAMSTPLRSTTRSPRQRPRRSPMTIHPGKNPVVAQQPP